MLGDSSSVANSIASPLSLPSMTLESQQYFPNFGDVVRRVRYKVIEIPLVVN
jgi:hypothetical protein